MMFSRKIVASPAPATSLLGDPLRLKRLGYVARLDPKDAWEMIRNVGDCVLTDSTSRPGCINLFAIDKDARPVLFNILALPSRFAYCGPMYRTPAQLSGSGIYKFFDRSADELMIMLEGKLGCQTRPADPKRLPADRKETTLPECKLTGEQRLEQIKKNQAFMQTIEQVCIATKEITEQKMDRIFFKDAFGDRHGQIICEIFLGGRLDTMCTVDPCDCGFLVSGATGSGQLLLKSLGDVFNYFGRMLETEKLTHSLRSGGQAQHYKDADVESKGLARFIQTAGPQSPYHLFSVRHHRYDFTLAIFPSLIGGKSHGLKFFKFRVEKGEIVLSETPSSGKACGCFGLCKSNKVGPAPMEEGERFGTLQALLDRIRPLF